VLKEFREFLLRGNLIDLAIAIEIGTAFVAVVKSLIDNIVMPIIGALIGKPSFAGLTFTIHDSIFHYGQFLTHLLLFVLIATVGFFFVGKATAGRTERFVAQVARPVGCAAPHAPTPPVGHTHATVPLPANMVR